MPLSKPELVKRYRKIVQILKDEGYRSEVSGKLIELCKILISDLDFTTVGNQTQAVFTFMDLYITAPFDHIRGQVKKLSDPTIQYQVENITYDYKVSNWIYKDERIEIVLGELETMTASYI
jgi:hypothetical protein